MRCIRAFAFSFWIILLAACGNSSPPNTAVPPSETSPALSTPVVTLIATARPTPAPSGAAIREVSILYTNDEHGWMQGVTSDAGAANLLGLWLKQEGYTSDTHLLLSGGDMWTGPAISTWFDGRSMVEVMNEMGYAAAAVGNHEFDFGLEAFKERAVESDFPFLSANLRYRRDGATPVDLGILPYTITTINEVQVGIIGLTTTSTPYTTHPRNVAEFDFLPYETAVRETMPSLEDEGAELVVVAAHVCRDELELLARAIGDLRVHMIGGGHCNELFAEEINGIILIEGGAHLVSYATVTFLFDTGSDAMVSAEFNVGENEGGLADAAVTAIVAQWQSKVEEELDVVIGYTESGIQRLSQAMQDLITESWLIAYPEADVAITNLGGMRAALPPGRITVADIIGVMPFNNVLVEVHLTGSQLLDVLAFASGDAAFGGLYQEGPQWHLDESGKPINPDDSYSVLVNDFMYAGGDGYTMLASFDPAAYDTAIDWRQPVIDWLEAQNSTAASPIDGAISDLGQP